MSTLNIQPIAVTGVLQPRDDFPGRSTTRFGVGELIDLTFTALPSSSAEQLGGLRWFIGQGGGKLIGSADSGQALYTAPAVAGPVSLLLKVTSGPDANTIVATHDIQIVAPSDAVMTRRPGSRLFHLKGTWSCNFLGEIFLRPTDVSFTHIMFGEGGAVATQSGYLTQLKPNHPIGALIPVGPGDIQHGCRVNAVDEVRSGILNAPFAAGDFEWPIPWEFSVNGSPRVRFTIATHHAEADANGRATIAKKGAGPFSTMPGDESSSTS